jgi:hypothetical protein
MSRVNKAYPHLLGGVSEESSERRGAGEHWEQDNLITDPVRGLTRRAGAKYRAQSLGARTLPGGHSVSTGTTRTYDFQVNQSQMAVVYDTKASGLGALILFNKNTGSIIPVTRPAGGNVSLLLEGGVRTATALGQYVVMAGPGLSPSYTTTERYGVSSNLRHHIVWIRGGAFSREYRVALVRGNQKLECVYTTPSAGYPEPLDTSGLNVNDPDYLKQVNDLTNQYNSAVNAWVAAALAAPQPDNIALTLAEEITNSGFLAAGETAEASGPNIYINAPSVEDVEVDDGGDGSLARGVGNTVAAAELLSLYHIPGKIVRVRPNNSTDGRCFYMQAVPKDGSTGGLTEVSWRETAGTRFTPTVVFGVLAVNDAGTAAWFNTDLTALRAADPNFADLPLYTASDAGDIDSNPPQRFLGQPATMLTTFQDRLVVGCGNSFNSSKTSDYFNFFRTSIVTVTADDPVNFVAIGGEDDIIRYALTHDRNLVVWGTGQYIVDGRKPLTPQTASAVRMASIKDAVDAPPVLGDKFIYFSRSRGDGTSSVHHLQPGRIQEAPETFELSRGLKTYLAGGPAEIIPGNDPDYLYVRTTGDNDLKVFAYQDAANGERVLSAWSRWTFNTVLGNLAGVSLYNGTVFLLFLDTVGSTVNAYLSAIAPKPGAEPYLDMWSVSGGGPAYISGVNIIAYGKADNYSGAGGTGTLYSGVPFDSAVTLTSPHATDRDGLPILNGRTVVNSVKVYTEDTSGVQWAVRSQGQCEGQGAWLVPQGEVVCPAGELTTILEEEFVTSPTARAASPVGIPGALWDLPSLSIVPGGVLATGNFDGGYNLSAAPTTSDSLTLVVELKADTAAAIVTLNWGTGSYVLQFQVAGSVTSGGALPPGVSASPITTTPGFAASVRATVQFTGCSGIPLTSLYLGPRPGGEAVRIYYAALYQGAEAAPVVGPVWSATSGVTAAPRINDLNGVNANGASFVNGEYRAYNEILPAAYGTILSLPTFEHASASVPVGRETREYRLTLQSYLWAPLTIKAVEWQGQLMYRSRRL